MSGKICNDWQVSLRMLYSWTHAPAWDWPAIYVISLSGIVYTNSSSLEHPNLVKTSSPYLLVAVSSQYDSFRPTFFPKYGLIAYRVENRPSESRSLSAFAE